MLIGKQEIESKIDSVNGEYIEMDGESYYKISNYDLMDPFFMSIVSNSDHWLFISSKGGLTAGRKNPDNALFPYYTDDVIHTSNETTGSKTILKVLINDKKYLWEPFSDRNSNIYNINRNIYKNIPGNKLLFEEVNNDLGLIFRYSWLNSERFGFIKKSSISNKNIENVEIEVLDGIQNILPYGIYQQFQSDFSTLADGYKKCELIEKDGIGIYSLSSIPSDKAEPSESLKATCVWSYGIDVKKYLLSSVQLDKFRSENEIDAEYDIRGLKGAYFINGEVIILPDTTNEWYIVSDINYDVNSVKVISHLLNGKNNVQDEIDNDINEGTKSLRKIVASSDGLQLSESKLGTARHFSNVLFNTMRGGIFDDSYWIQKNDYISYIKTVNVNILETYSSFFDDLDDKVSYFDLKRKVYALNDQLFKKLFLEYLPLTFSRRHGDPSRPWNRFSIEIKDKRNNKILNYQGNWRDLFQNWEALAFSYPFYITSMIAKFVNATTADGYNPYRVTTSGFDWETPDPNMPWSNIGYWGDHQIIYLLKLLELSYNHNSKELVSNLTQQIYSYANVPYKIKSYKELVADPQNTIEFDEELHNRILDDESKIGSDAKFLTDSNNSMVQVNLGEKLLVTLLAKLSNFVPGAGIWMNTQRPEWNDANNALVGNGVSMVTLFYIRRYVTFCIDLFSKLDNPSIKISSEVLAMFEGIDKVLDDNKDLIINGISDIERKNVLDGLGTEHEKYRNYIYNYGLSTEKEELKIAKIISFLTTVKEYSDNTILQNKRIDGLYHSYNLITITDDKININYLYEMLEGQVAALSSGYLSVKESIDLLQSLRKSSLYRADQNSYILYPNRSLPLFIEKNIIPSELFDSSSLLTSLLRKGNDDIVTKDIDGNYHFNTEIRNSKILDEKIRSVSKIEESEFSSEEVYKVLEIYETVFNHKAFTGRSGTFYKYEGLGSIYWHMVSKLLLAVQENYFLALENNSDEKLLTQLKDFYYDIKDGIGLKKSPKEYGAFPTDPYSHTPSFSGVQQPGMTGQVKEDIISKYGELGIRVNDGQIEISAELLLKNEFLAEQETFKYFDVNNNEQKIEIEKESLAFTYNQVPFVYTFGSENKVIIIYNDKESTAISGLRLPKEISDSIFIREGLINKIMVQLNY